MNRKEAHEANLDAAWREISRRQAEGEDMRGASVCPRTYAIKKPRALTAQQRQEMHERISLMNDINLE